jgi:hypothetical protein
MGEGTGTIKFKSGIGGAGISQRERRLSSLILTGPTI